MFIYYIKVCIFVYYVSVFFFIYCNSTSLFIYYISTCLNSNATIYWNYEMEFIDQCFIVYMIADSHLLGWVSWRRKVMKRWSMLPVSSCQSSGSLSGVVVSSGEWCSCYWWHFSWGSTYITWDSGSSSMLSIYQLTCRFVGFCIVGCLKHLV